MLRSGVDGWQAKIVMWWLICSVLWIHGGKVYAQGVWLKAEIRNLEVIDGDTLRADFDGNGTISSDEKVRLIYVDTPEIGDNSIRWNRQDGLLARRFLQQRLQRFFNRQVDGPQQLILWLPQGLQWGNYGRLLAVVCEGEESMNLALVRAGWSPLFTRYQVPADYSFWLQAEAEAFVARRGIWKQRNSRQYYLSQLRADGRTVRSKKNKFDGGHHQLSDWDSGDLRRWNNRFVELEGVVSERFRGWAGGWPRWSMKIHDGSKQKTLEVRFSSSTLRRAPQIENVRVGHRVRVEGWLKSQKKHYWLEVHYLWPAHLSSIEQVNQCRSQR